MSEAGTRVTALSLRGGEVQGNWGGVRTKATMGTGGAGCAVREHKDTKDRGDKRLLELQVARTSSKSIEPSERSLHGGGGSIHIFY